MANYKPGEDTKNAILSVSKVLFYKQGIKNTTYDQISKAAHVNIGTIVYHFKSIDNIACLVYRQLLKDRHIAFANKIKNVDLPEDADEGVLALVEFRTHTESYLQYPNYQRFISEVLFQSDVWNDEYLNKSLYMICKKYHLELSEDELTLNKYLFIPFSCMVANSINSNMFTMKSKTMCDYHAKTRLLVLGIKQDEIDKLLVIVDEIASKIRIDIDGEFNFC